MKNILIANQFGIGDVLFTFPVIKALKEKFPQARIGYLCNRRTEELVRDNPYINDVFVYEKDELKAKGSAGYLQGLSKLVGEIKTKRYDVVFDLTLSRLFGFLFLMAGIKKRVGYDYKGRGLFLTDRITIDGYHDKHMVNYYADLLPFLDIKPAGLKMEVYTKDTDKKWAQDFLKEGRAENRLLVGIVPGGGASWGKDAFIKRWDSQNFAKLAHELEKACDARIAVFGAASEKDLCENIKSQLSQKAIDACGKTTLGQFAALLSKCRLVITNDGGPLHVAVASGARTVSIFGPVDEKVYGPFAGNGKHMVVKAEIACRPCYKNFKYKECGPVTCLRQVSVDDVLKAARALLEER